MKAIVETTKSICPVCKKIIDAGIIEESGSIFMEKQCDEHGFFKSPVSKYAWYYKGLNSLYDRLSPSGHPLSERTIRTIQFYPTSKCNLSCPICYTHSDEKAKDRTLEEIRKMALSIKGRKTISVLGGEPTLRKDIFQIIEAFSKAGHFVEFFTNGITLKDMNYLRSLKKSGINMIQIGLETLSDDTVNERLRGKGVLEDKKTALDNLKKMNIKTGIIDVVLRGVTERYISEVADFAIRNRFIHELSVRGYSHIGKLGFSLNEEFTIDELVEIFEKETKGLVTLEEFYIFQKITYILRYLLYDTPQCYVNQHIFIPRNGKKMRDIFPPDEFSGYIELFEDMFKAQPLRAKVFFLKKLFLNMAKRSPSLMLQRILQNKIPYFDSRYYLFLEFAMFYTPYNLDLEKTKKRCADAWLPSYCEGKLEDYCGMLCHTTELDESPCRIGK